MKKNLFVMLACCVMMLCVVSCDIANDADSSSPQIYYDNEAGGSITAVGFENGISVTVPDIGSVAIAYVVVDIYNNSGGEKTIALTLSSSSNGGASRVTVTVVNGGRFYATVPIRLNDVAAGRALKLWHDSSTYGHGSENLTGVVLNADVTFWVSNIDAAN